VRQGPLPFGQFREIPDEIKELMRVDQANTAWLTELTARRGWPGRTLVGKDGAHVAWLLAQHADPQSQPAFLDLLREAVAAGEASASDLAYLEDRVRMHAGQPQLYGTSSATTRRACGSGQSRIRRTWNSAAPAWGSRPSPNTSP
jgi:hypothetical protein